MRRTTFLALHLACGAVATAAAGNVRAEQQVRVDGAGLTHVCGEHPQVTVQAMTRADAEAACDGASRSLRFLARAGIDGPASMTIEVVPELPGDIASRAVGCFVRETKRILLLSFSAFQAGGGWFRMPPSRDLYRAAASHEMAHAVVACHSESRRLAIAAHEYVAYVVFFATMDAPLRAALLLKFPGAGFKSAGQISDINHIVDPNQFGVDSWRHYLRTSDREVWLRKVIAGEVVPEVSEDPGASSR